MAVQPHLPEPCRLLIRASATTCSRLHPLEQAYPVSASWNLRLPRLGPSRKMKPQLTLTVMESPIWQLFPATALSAPLSPSRFSSATETEHSGLDRRFNLPTCRITHQ